MTSAMTRSLLSLVAGLLLLLFLLFTAGGEAASAWVWLGRLHPLFVHLPIGILFMALVLELFRQRPEVAGAIPAVLFVGAWSAILAALAGLLLADSGGYDPATLAWHQRLGVGVAVWAVVAYALRARQAASASPLVYRGVLVLLLAGLAVGGHLGGTLTHGDDYLTRRLPDGLRRLAGLPPQADLGKRLIANPDTTSVYAALIQPIFNDHCVACHRVDRTEGGLALDTPEHLLAGGDEGDVLVPGRADDSELIRRLWLPTEHPDHMPPEEPLSIAEAELLRWWIDQGASFETTLAEAERTPTIRRVLDAYGLDALRTGIFALKVPLPDSSAVAALRATGLAVQTLAEEEPFLQVHATNVARTLTSADLDRLRLLAAQVAWLDLARTPVGDSTLALLATLPHLTRLHLEHTRVTDAGLQQLKDLSYLEYLNLYGTAVTDAGLRHLEGLTRLRRLYLWQTNVTPEGVERLKQALPKLEVNLGATVPAAQASDETPVPPRP